MSNETVEYRQCTIKPEGEKLRICNTRENPFYINHLSSTVEKAKEYIDKEMDEKEQYSFNQCESRIHNCLKQTPISIGEQLGIIREYRWYKIGGFKSFETYCKTKWKFTRQYASKCILAWKSSEKERLEKAKLSTKVDSSSSATSGSTDNDDATKDDGPNPIEGTTKECSKFQKAVSRVHKMLTTFVPHEEMYQELASIRKWIKDYEELQVQLQAMRDEQLKKEAEFEKAEAEQAAAQNTKYEYKGHHIKTEGSGFAVLYKGGLCSPAHIPAKSIEEAKERIDKRIAMKEAEQRQKDDAFAKAA